MRTDLLVESQANSNSTQALLAGHLAYGSMDTNCIPFTIQAVQVWSIVLWVVGSLAVLNR